MTVEDVIKEYAKQNGFDGLVGCVRGCSIDSGPCDEDISVCEFGYVCHCRICDTDLRKNCAAYKGDYYEYMVLPEKCEMRLRTEQRKAEPVEEPIIAAIVEKRLPSDKG